MVNINKQNADEMCKITEKLKEIVDLIPDDTASSLSIADFYEIRDGLIGYKTSENGFAESRSLFSHKHISIALTSVPDGKKFPEHRHNHPIQELLVVLSGALKMKIDEEEKEVNEGELVVVKSNIKHDAIAVGDATFVVLTIPRDYGFPE